MDEKRNQFSMKMGKVQQTKSASSVVSGTEGSVRPSDSISSKGVDRPLVEAMKDPVCMIGDLVAQGVSVVLASEIVNNFYKCKAGLLDSVNVYYDVASEASASEVVPSSLQTTSSISSRSSRRRAAKRRWFAVRAAYGDDDNYCYLRAFRLTRRAEMREFLGEEPTFSEICAAVVERDIDKGALFSLRVVYRGVVSGVPRFHLSYVPVAGDLGTFRDAICAIKALGSHLCPGLSWAFLGEKTLTHEIRTVPVPLSARVGSSLVVAPACLELKELAKRDLAQCFCAVHTVPVTKSSVLATRGCVQLPAGRAEVISSAYDGLSVTCHADEATRWNDYRMLMYVLRYADPMILDGAKGPSGFRKLCTSSMHTDMAAFGNGYCYLSAMSHNTWWRVARLLGPNPYVRNVYSVHKWCGLVEGNASELVEVAPGYYHVVTRPCGSYFPGRAFSREMLRIMQLDPDARVGLLSEDVAAIACACESCVPRDRVVDGIYTQVDGSSESVLMDQRQLRLLVGLYYIISVFRWCVLLSVVPHVIVLLYWLAALFVDRISVR